MPYVSKKEWNTAKVSLLIIVLFLVICLAGCNPIMSGNTGGKNCGVWFPKHFSRH